MELAKDKPRTIVLAALLGAAALVAFWPLTRCDFINYDDTAYVTENPLVLAGFSLANVGGAFRTTCLGNWHPLTLVSHMVDVQCFGLNAGGHHFTSVCLHVANTVLLFLLLQRWTRRGWESAFVAGLFALHPLHVESVAWISERKDLLSTFFALLSLLAYGRYAEVRMPNAECRMKAGSAAGNAARSISASFLVPASCYLFALLCFALSLLSKAMYVTLPALMLLLDYWPLKRVRIGEWGMRNAECGTRSGGEPSAQDEATNLQPPVSSLPALLLEKVPFLVLAIAGACASVMLLSASGATREVVEVGLGERFGRAAAAYQHYLAKMFWPCNLTMPYLRPGRWPLAEIVSAAIILVALTLGAVWQWRRRPWLLVGWCWFLGMLIPVIGLVPVGVHAMADRYTYFPLIGLFLALACCAAELGRRSRLAPASLAVVAAAILVGCLAATRAQVRFWRDSETLFRHAIAVNPANYIAHGAVGLHLFNHGKAAEAIGHYERAIQINPLYDVGHSSLARALADLKRYDEAVAHFEIALRLRPDDVKTRNNFGGVLLLQGRYEAAAREFEEVARLQPDHARSHNNLAICCKKLGRIGDAITHYREALRLQPDSPEALNNLAWLLAAHPEARFRNGTEAVTLATRVCELTRYQNPVPLASLAAAYAEIGRYPEAISFAEQAQAPTKDSPGALAERLSAMLEAFRAGHPYRAE
jgi:protein O-mannosyl-transferase